MSDLAVVVVHANHGVGVGTDAVWKFATENEIPKVIVLNAFDKEETDFEKNLAQLALGQKAFASADAYPRERFAAELFYINPGIDALRGLGMSDLQIEEIHRERKASPHIGIYSPVSGFVLARSISPRQWFDKGTEKTTKRRPPASYKPTKRARPPSGAEVQAIGAGAVNQAVKALVLATGYLKNDNILVVCVPEFADVTIDDKVRTAIKFVVEPR